MSNALNQLQNLSFENLNSIPGWAGIAAGVAVPTALFAVDYLRTPKTAGEGLIGADVTLLDEVVQEETSGRFKSRLGRWGSVMIAGTALSFASAQLLDPITEKEVSVSGVANVHVLDASESMQKTRDMDDGLTRYESVTSALLSSYETAPEDLTAATVLFGQNAEVTAALSTDRTSLANGLDPAVINANGGSLDLALDRASDILAGSDNPGGETLYVYTDGTIERREEAMNRLVALAQDTNIVIVMPGTADGSFQRSDFDTAPTPSGVDQRGFAQLDEQFDTVSLLTTNGADDIEQTVSEIIKQDTTATEKQPFYGFLWAAGGLLVASTALNAIQR